jgi:hypothetical protein
LVDVSLPKPQYAGKHQKIVGTAMTKILTFVFFAGAIVLMVQSVIVMSRFMTFCDAVASAQDQWDQLANPVGTGEGGLNRFETQQFNLLISGKFEHAYEGVLLDRARVLARQLRHNLRAAICFVAISGIFVLLYL